MFDPGSATVPLADGSSVDLDGLPADELEDLLSSVSAEIARLECMRAAVVAAVDRRRVWGQGGMRSLGHYVSWRTGLMSADARRVVALARALPGAPRLATAFADGTLSSSQVACAAGVVTPDNEAMLLHWAHGLTGPQLQRACRGLARVTPTDAWNQARPDPAEAPSRCFWRWDDDRRLRVNANLRADDDAVVIAALEAARHQIRRERADAADGPAGEAARREPQVARGEQLVRMAMSALAGQDGVRSGADRHQFVVRLDVSEVPARGDASAHLEGGVHLGPSVLRRLMCDATIVPVLTAGSEPLAVGRRRRSPTAAQRRAVMVRDSACCRFPGCDAQQFLEVHHVMEWEAGGPTDLDNLVALCWHHHKLVHDERWTIRVPTGRPRTDSGDWEFVARSGRVVRNRPPDNGGDGRRWEVAVGRASPGDAGPAWNGERMTRWALLEIVGSLLRRAA